MFKWIVVPVLIVSLAGCGSDSGSTTSSTSPTPSPAPPPAPRMSSIAMEVLDSGWVATNVGNAVGGSVRFTESGGVGANINFMRLEVFRATGQFEERVELGSGRIIRDLGDNRIEANTQEQYSIVFPLCQHP